MRIDLGTTNSCVSVMDGKSPKIIANSEGLRTTASIVAYTKKQELLLDKEVIFKDNLQKIFGDRPFSKLEITSTEVASNDVNSEVIEDDKKNIKLDSRATTHTKSKDIVEQNNIQFGEYIGQTINEAVITVPAYFNDSQRQATKDAGKIAGLNVRRILNEPTAAALAYGLDQKDNETILVFDLGGGTFDVSILEVGDGVFEVLATSGDTHLGGDDFDEKIVQWLVQEFKSAEGIDLTQDNQALQRLTEAAEKAKVELSNLSQASINLPFISVSSDGPKHLEKELTRAKFEELCSDLIQRCKTPIQNALKDAELTPDAIDQNVLVGGSTRIPAVQELVKSLLGKEPNQTVNPDEVVAVGAAVQAGVLGGEVKDILLLDVTPLSLGVETLGGITTKITPRNTIIPTKKSETFSTAVDNQPNVEIHVLQGERELAKDNKSLGTFRLDGIASAPRGVPQIEVTFDIDASGILSVTAKDKATNKQQSITISGASTLPKEDVERMVEEAEANAAADKEKSAKIETKNQADSICYQTKKQLEELESKIDAGEKEKVEALLTKLQAAIDTDDTDSINNQNLDQKLITTQTSKLKDLMVSISDKLNVTEPD